MNPEFSHIKNHEMNSSQGVQALENNTGSSQNSQGMHAAVSSIARSVNSHNLVPSSSSLSATTAQPKQAKLDQDLINACSSGNLKKVIGFINQGANINAQGKAPSFQDKGMSSLMWASRNGHLAVVKALTSKKDLQINAASQYKGTALMQAAEQGHLHVVTHLLERNDIELNASDKDGNTALMKAVQQGKSNVVRTLLKRKDINLEQKNHIGRTAVFNAVYNQSLEVLSLLVNANAKVSVADQQGNTALHCAVIRPISEFNRQPQCVQLLLKAKNINVDARDAYGETPLQMAVEAGDFLVVKLLLKAGADLFVKNDAGKSVYALAIRHEHHQIASYLKNLVMATGSLNKVNPNSKSKPEPELIQGVLGRSKNELHRQSPLIASLLKTPGLNIDVTDSYGDTALQCAVMIGDLQTVKQLLKAGANPMLKNSDNKTILQLAIRHDHKQLAQYLLTSVPGLVEATQKTTVSGVKRSFEGKKDKF